MKAFKYFTLSFDFPSFTQRERIKQCPNWKPWSLRLSKFTVSIVIEILIVFYLRDKK